MKGKKYTLLVLEDDEFSLENLRLSLTGKNYNLIFCSTPIKALEYSNKGIDLIISDLKLPGYNGVEIIKKYKEHNPDIKSILITGYSDEPLIVKALKEGIDDILKKPYEEVELHNSINSLLHQIELENENKNLKEKAEKENLVLKSLINKRIETDEYLIVGQSKVVKDVLTKALTISRHEVNTLIYGESGTGKELLARYIHSNGPRKDAPFIPINCAELSPALFESELFGYVKGAYTDAQNPRAGLIEIADGGILFLDEVTEMPIPMQTKLLRVIEDKKVRRMGGNEWIDVNIQIISSTNRNIDEAIADNILRNDFYHRLTETLIHLPPLRERIDDFPLLINYFISKYELLLDINAPKLSDEYLEIMKNSDWKGNLRQLSNFIKAFCLFGSDWNTNDIIQNINNGYNLNIDLDLSFRFVNGNMEELDQAKIWLINRALKKYNGNKTKAAEHLGITYQGLLKMLNKNS